MMITPSNSSFVHNDDPYRQLPHTPVPEVHIHIPMEEKRSPQSWSQPPVRPSVSTSSATTSVAEFTFESIAEHANPLLCPKEIADRLNILHAEKTAIQSRMRSVKNILKGKTNEVVSFAMAGLRATVAAMPAMAFLPAAFTAASWSWAPALFGLGTDVGQTILTRNSGISASAELSKIDGERQELLTDLANLYLEKSEVFITKYVNHTYTHIDLIVNAESQLMPFIATIRAEENNDINRKTVNNIVNTAKKLHEGLEGKIAPAYGTQLQKQLNLTEQETTFILAHLKETVTLIELKDRVARIQLTAVDKASLGSRVKRIELRDRITRETLKKEELASLNSMVATKDMYQVARDRQDKSLVKLAQERMRNEAAMLVLKERQNETDILAEIGFTTLDAEIDNVKTQLEKTNKVVDQQRKQVNVLAQKVDAGFTRVDADIAQHKLDTEGKIINVGRMLTALSTKIDELNGTIAAQNARIEEQARDIAAQSARIEKLITSNNKRKTEITNVLHNLNGIEHGIKGMQSGPVNVHGDLVVKIPISRPATSVTYSSSATPITISRTVPRLLVPRQTFAEVFPSGSGDVFPSGSGTK